jgi:hypothetical protein
VAFSGEEPHASPRSKINVYCPPDGKVEHEGASGGASEAGRSERQAQRYPGGNLISFRVVTIG